MLYPQVSFKWRIRRRHTSTKTNIFRHFHYKESFQLLINTEENNKTRENRYTDETKDAECHDDVIPVDPKVK